MRKVKLLSIIAAVIYVFISLAACDSREDDLLLMYLHEPLTILSTFPDIDKFEKKVQEKYPEISFEIIPYAGSNTTSYISSMVKAGEIPDIFVNTVYAPGLHNLEDKLVDLSGYDFTVNYNASGLQSVSSDGAIYMLPTFYSCVGITYNKTLLDKHGWELPNTFEQLKELAPKVKAAGCRLALNQLALPGYGFQYMCNILDTGYFNTLGGRKWQKDFLNGKTSISESPEMMQSFKIVQEWKDLGMLNAEGDLNSDAATKKMMAEGNTLFMLGSSNTFNATESTDEFRLIPYLSEDGTKNSLIIQTAFYVGISKTLEDNPQKLQDALHVMEILSTVDGMNSLNTDFVNTKMLPLIDYVVPETSIYKPVEPFLEKGQTAPFIYSGWEGLIVPAGNAGIEYICGNITLDELISAIDANRSLLQDDTPSAYTTITEKLTNKDCARLVGVCFGKAANADLALISTNECHIIDGKMYMNYHGVSGELFALPVHDEQISSIFPTGWHGTIHTITATGAQIKRIAEEGYDYHGHGINYPYLTVTPKGFKLDDETVYTAVITGANTQVKEEFNYTDTGISGLLAAQNYFKQFESFSSGDIVWE